MSRLRSGPWLLLAACIVGASCAPDPNNGPTIGGPTSDYPGAPTLDAATSAGGPPSDTMDAAVFEPRLDAGAAQTIADASAPAPQGAGVDANAADCACDAANDVGEGGAGEGGTREGGAGEGGAGEGGAGDSGRDAS